MQTKKDILVGAKKKFFEEIKKYQKTLRPTNEIVGFGSSAIVGEKNYPSLKIHNVINSDIENSYEKSSIVAKKSYDEIFKLKAKNILSTTNSTYVKNVDDRIKREISDIYKSKNIVDFTTEFSEILKFNSPVLSNNFGSIGTKNDLKNITANTNTKTSKQIEKYTAGDVKSNSAIIDLYERGISEHKIINILALGEFGISHNKKLVPTRWAITAYDSCITKYLHKKIIKYNSINNYELYENIDKGNHFLVLIMPGIFSYENFEFTPTGWQAQDFVDYKNKLGYSEPNTAGGFFATEIGVIEKLLEKKKQAQIIVFRRIEDYEVPLGVVFVRESVRCAIKNNPIFKTESKTDLEEFLKLKFPEFYTKYINSKTLFEERRQKKLNNWF